MKHAKNILAEHENWENVNAEELWRIWKGLLKCLSLIVYSFHAIVKLTIRFLLNSNCLVKHHEIGKPPEEICSPYHSNNQNWYYN